MRLKWLALLCLVLLAACGGDDTAPVNQVKAFVAATEARDVDAMVALMTPSSRRDAQWQLNQVMPTVTSIQYRDAQYRLEEIKDGRAYVQIAGTLVAATSDGQSVEQPVAQLVELVQTDGIWYIAANNFQLPQAPGGN
jgi:hypothetical protein